MRMGESCRKRRKIWDGKGVEEQLDGRISLTSSFSSSAQSSFLLAFLYVEEKKKTRNHVIFAWLFSPMKVSKTIFI